MPMLRSRAATFSAVLAVLSLTATPVLARGHDDWRRHDYYRGHHRGGGIDGGDLLTGLLVIGGVAAIATAVSKNDADRRDRENGPDPYRYPGGPQADGQGYGAPADEDAPGTYPGGPVAGMDSGGFDGAVDACSATLEQGERQVDTVDNVRRIGERYSVEGRLSDGQPYACSVDDAGHVRSVAVDGHGMI